MSGIEPVLKWVGGKRALLPQISGHFPKELDGTYFEPFLGGGSVALSMLYRRSILNDSNEELILFYEMVRDRLPDLLDTIRSLPVTKDSYYQIRDWDKEHDFMSRPSVERAARLYFLNKCGFNGLYRVNRSGKFNVPFANKSTVSLPVEKFIALSNYLQGNMGLDVTLVSQDFAAVVNNATQGDLVYFDPPYIPVSKTSNFVSYGKQGFSPFDQERLANVISSLTEKGVRVLMSNSNANETWSIFSPLGTLHKVEVQRNISASGEHRTRVVEVLFDNIGELTKRGKIR
jgi:DNA adenine methylase